MYSFTFQVKELDALFSKDKAILQIDGKFSIQSSVPSESDSVIQISDDEDDGSDNLKCKICKSTIDITLNHYLLYNKLNSVQLNNKILFPLTTSHIWHNINHLDLTFILQK